MKRKLLVFDVESASLFGEAIAVGALVGDLEGNITDEFVLVSKESLKNSNEWVLNNVIPNLTDLQTCHTNYELRNSFYTWYLKHYESCSIWSDVNFPVETNFMAAVANDDLANREFKMPYPLYDISNFVPISIDRIATCGIKGLRKHNPLDDAKASYFCFLKAIKSENIQNQILNLITDGK